MSGRTPFQVSDWSNPYTTVSKAVLCDLESGISFAMIKIRNNPTGHLLEVNVVASQLS